MKNETAEVLNQLAAKLGVTIEHLWAVLIKQAFISGITDLGYYLFTAICAFIFIRLHFHFCKQKGAYEYSGYDRNEFLTPLMFGVGVLLGIIILVEFFAIGYTISAFLNPEYWALNKILSSLE